MAMFKNTAPAPKTLISDMSTDFTAPHSARPRIRSFQFEGHGGINAAFQPTAVGTQLSVFAPRDLVSLGVLQDARNRVGF